MNEHGHADEFCEGYPHSLTPTPGYWIECSRQSGRGGQSHGIREESQEDSSPETSIDREHEEDEVDTNVGDAELCDDSSVATTDHAGRQIQLVHQHIQVVALVRSSIHLVHSVLEIQLS